MRTTHPEATLIAARVTARLGGGRGECLVDCKRFLQAVSRTRSRLYGAANRAVFVDPSPTAGER